MQCGDGVYHVSYLLQDTVYSSVHRDMEVKTVDTGVPLLEKTCDGILYSVVWS